MCSGYMIVVALYSGCHYPRSPPSPSAAIVSLKYSLLGASANIALAPAVLQEQPSNFQLYINLNNGKVHSVPGICQKDC